MSDEIELHPAVAECILRTGAELDALRAAVREYLAAEASVAYALADDTDAGDAAAMVARMHDVRTRRDEALARLRRRLVGDISPAARRASASYCCDAHAPAAGDR